MRQLIGCLCVRAGQIAVTISPAVSVAKVEPIPATYRFSADWKNSGNRKGYTYNTSCIYYTFTVVRVSD